MGKVARWSVTVYLDGSEYRRLKKLSDGKRQSMSRTARELLVPALPPENG
jgi:hypothetical protein